MSYTTHMRENANLILNIKNTKGWMNYGIITGVAKDCL